MSLVHESDAYRAYCNLYNCIGRLPLSKSKWRKQNNTPNKQNRTAEDIRRELKKIKERA